MNRVDRLMGYLLLFQSRGLMRAQDFSQQFEISERTVYRDIQSLCEVGVPIMAMPGEGYRLMEGYYLPPITFTPDEARSLYLAISIFSAQATPGPTQDAAKEALDKVRAILPITSRKRVEALEAIINFYSFPKAALNFDDSKLLRLQDAIHQRRVVHVYYHSLNSNELTERDLEPIELIFLDKVWMLSAYCRLRQDQRMFRLDRIDTLKVHQETFTPHVPERHRVEQGTEPIVVKFEASVVRWVREKQHFSFVDERKVDGVDPGDCFMVYQPRTFRQIKGWLLSWGDQMEVIEPPHFREEIARTAATILNRHQK